MSKHIAILGCGWLGFCLAKKLVQDGHHIHGSVTTEGKLNALVKAGIKPFIIKLDEDKIEGDVQGFLENMEILFINIPPGLRKNPNYNYHLSIVRLKEVLREFPKIKVIFTSSTSVFENEASFPVYDETIQPNGTSNASKQLIAAENEILERPNSQILRPGGLLGGARHPINRRAGRTLKNADAPVNMIDRRDLISIIEYMFSGKIEDMIVHAVFETTLSRKQYYQEKATEFSLQPPIFEDTQQSGKKIIAGVLKKHDILLKHRV